ncbi:hypothetical protein [Aquabacterium sp.]|uniref:hypothetical protein n=1 Tax=Aquabacterium sp. TaxID=1872578 RepID=UPI002E3242D6|nr:hypothetical protein [Aquabacterium sp.]HEX5312080.1 hypothetical protein [Aquabacterium sp.]
MIRRSAMAHDWARELDFVGPRVRTSVWGWALLVIGLCLALMAADQVQSVAQQQAQEEASLHRLQRAEHQQKLAQAPMRPASGASGAAGGAAWSAEALRSAQGVVSKLAYPWAKVLDQVELAALHEQALLLALSVDLDAAAVDATAATVRLSAAVLSDEDALRWADAHGAGAQLLARERLPSPAPSPQGDYPWRAEISWQRGRP